MTFQEKSNALVLGVPFLTGAGFDTPTGLPISMGLLVVSVIALVAIAIVGHILIAALNPKDAGAEDERDALIEVRGDQRGGVVVAFGAVCAMGLALIGTAHFWIVNVILAGLVLGEVVKAVSKIVDYRRGV